MKISSYRSSKPSRWGRLLVGAALVVVLVGAYFAFPWLRTRGARMLRLREWFDSPQTHPEWTIQAGQVCDGAPFIMPTNGYVGFLWGDSFRPGHAHQGTDIFGGLEAGQAPVLAAYPGFLTRLPEWKSTLIIRIPSDPLQPERQIWAYYTHLADQSGASYISPEFPPGTSEMFVEAGTFLGYQGDYSGDPNNPTGVHLHFSIVQDDGQGSFRNELRISNTLDPSPYLGLRLNARQNPAGLSVCEPNGEGS